MKLWLICQLELHLGTNLLHRIPTAHALHDKLLAALGNCFQNSLNDQQAELKLQPRGKEHRHGKCSFSPCSDCLHRTIGSKNSTEPTPSILVRVYLRGKTPTWTIHVTLLSLEVFSQTGLPVESRSSAGSSSAPARLAACAQARAPLTPFKPYTVD